MQISVHSAQMISFRRPVARTAARKSGSSHALVEVRSIGGLFASTSASGGSVGWPRPVFTLMVECTIGTPNSFATFAVETTFLSSRSRSIDRTPAIWLGWEVVHTPPQLFGGPSGVPTLLWSRAL